ncbi:MAG: flippase [Dehalococcoidia bacterium]
MDGDGDSLRKITRGTGIAFIGLLVGLGSNFLCKILAAKIGTEEQYGNFSIALSILNIGAIIATLGLIEGSARSIAFSRGKNDIQKVQDLITASLRLSLLVGIFLGLSIFLASDLIDSGIFPKASVGFPLKIVATAVPFLTLIFVLAAVFRGFDNLRVRVYFQDILRNAGFLAPLAIIWVFNLSFNLVYYTLLASVLFCSIAVAIYSFRRLSFSPASIFRLRRDPVAKELLLFSLPLLGATVLYLIVQATDTLMLGAIKGSADTGLYSAAYPSAQFFAIPVAAVEVIYVPIASGLYARGNLDDIRKTFSTITKWISSASLPLFLVVFLFPETVLRFLFGVDYTTADNALRILCLGFMIQSVTGPNLATLIAMGRSNFVMFATLATAIINVVLNLALIPPYGIEGAAIASASSMVVINLIRGWKLYSLNRTHPFSRNLLKPASVCVAIVMIIYFVTRNAFSVEWWMLPILLLACYVIYGFAMLVTWSIDEQDRELYFTVQRKTGIDLSFLSRLGGFFR